MTVRITMRLAGRVRRDCITPPSMPAPSPLVPRDAALPTPPTAAEVDACEARIDRAYHLQHGSTLATVPARHRRSA